MRSSLPQLDLVDEYRFVVHPVVSGRNGHAGPHLDGVP
jgi:hypothetical protein